MAILVELTNHPYEQHMKLLIDGRPTYAYSSLARFMNEPFVYWCSRILKALYEECNQSTFRLKFCSRDEELEVMAVQARRSPYCEEFIPVPLPDKTPLTKRMAGLSRLIRQEGLSGYRSFRYRAVFLLPPGFSQAREELMGLQIQNVYCSIEPVVMDWSQYQGRRSAGEVCFLLNWDGTVREELRRRSITAGFGIQVGARNGFLGICNGVLCYGTSEAGLIDTVLHCLQLGPLTEIFCACIASIPDPVREQYRPKLEALTGAFGRILVKAGSTSLETGQSSPISFRLDLTGAPVRREELAFDYSSPGIISCDGTQVTGLKAGAASLKIYRKGERRPFEVIAYQVILRNRITELFLEEDSLLLGEGDKGELHLTFLPEDADNTASIRWSSDRPSVARVDQDGIVRACRAGVCRITCQAEGVSVSADCQVKPRLKRIHVNETELVIPYGETAQLVCRTEPADCVDGELEMESLDMQTANVIGTTVRAVGYGSTRIIIQNVQGTVREEVLVTVPGRERPARQGFLSKLFGN